MANTEWTTNLAFDEDASFNVTFEGAETFNTTMDEVVEVVTSDHRQLTHRDAEEQHPITAITYLATELSSRPSAPMTNQEILDILNV